VSLGHLQLTASPKPNAEDMSRAIPCVSGSPTINSVAHGGSNRFRKCCDCKRGRRRAVL